MKYLESYHVVGFILAYLSLYQSYEITASEIKIQQNIYLLCALAPLLIMVSSSDSAALEQLVLILAYAFTIRSVSTLLYFKDMQTKPQKSNIEHYAHMVFLISILMLIYNRKINVYGAYVGMCGFSILSLLSRKVTVSFCIQDYIILHLLFFFTK